MSADGLYLPPARSGVAWLLDPDHPHLAERVDAALASTADTPVDPDAFSDDLGVLALLLVTLMPLPAATAVVVVARFLAVLADLLLAGAAWAWGRRHHLLGSSP